MKSTQLKSIVRPMVSFTAIALAALIAGCSGTHRARSVSPSGFLGDYSELRKGPSGQAKLEYIRPNVDWDKYHKVILDPIKVYCTPERSWFRKATPEQVKALVDYFDAAIRKNLNDEVTFVDEPGPGVMRWRIAITEAHSGNVPLDVVSSVIPIGLAISTLKSLAVGKGTGIGEVGAELEVLDSQTGERLAAFVDARIGDKFTGKFDKFDQWRAVKASFDYWAMRCKVRLVELQGEQK